MIECHPIIGWHFIGTIERPLRSEAEGIVPLPPEPPGTWGPIHGDRQQIPGAAGESRHESIRIPAEGL
jgi:hypothetical protein